MFGRTTAQLTQPDTRRVHRYEVSMADVALWICLGTLVLSVWPQALYFPYSGLWVAGLLLGCTGWMLGLLPRSGWLAVLPWLVAGLGYTLALTHAADAGAAQSGAIEHLTLLVVAAGAWILGDGRKDLPRVLAGTVAGLVALLGWAIPVSTARWFQVGQGLLFQGRWSSVFQYPDTAGALWGAGFLGLLFLQGSGRPWVRRLMRGAMVINGAAFLLALSRGADLMMPLGLAAGLLIVAQRGNWAQWLNALGFGGAGGLVISLLWRGALPANSFGPIIFLGITGLWVAGWEALEWGWAKRWLGRRQPYIVSVATAVVIVLGLGFYIHHKSGEPVTATASKPYSISTKLLRGQVTAATSTPATLTISAESRYDNETTVASSKVGKALHSIKIPNKLPSGTVDLRLTVTPVKGSSALLLLRVGTQDLLPWYVHVLPESFYSRLLQVSGRQLSVWQRGIFTKDGIHMALQRPVLGWGGGGWAAGYMQYQSIPYLSQEVHNGWVQWWVDGGALAGLAYAALLAGAAWAVYRGYLEKDLGRKRTMAALAAMVVVLLAHAVVDWDLAFFWVDMLVAILWTVLMRLAWPIREERPVAGPKAKAKARSREWPLWIAGATSGLLAIMTFFMVGAYGAYKAAVKANQQHASPTLILAKAKQAASLDGYLGEATGMVAQVQALQAAQKGSTVSPSIPLQNFQTAVKLLPYNADIRLSYAQLLVNTGQGQSALLQLSKAQQDAPMQLNVVNNVLSGIYSMLAAGLTQGNQGVAQAAAQQLEKSVANYHKAQASIPQGMISSLTLPPLLGASALVQGVADLLEGKQAAATTIFTSNLGSPQLNGTAQAWHSVLSMVQAKQYPSTQGQLATVAHNLVAYHLIQPARS